MYTILLIAQFLSCVVLFVSLFRLSKFNGFNSTRYLMLSAVCIIVYQVGYLGEMFSDSVEVAKMCLRFEYLGLSFIALCFYKFVSEYCNIRPLKTIFVHFLMLLDCCVMFTMMACDHTTLYYTSVSFVETGLFPHIETGKGILYIYFSIQQTSLMVLCSIIFFWYYKSKGRKKDRQLYLALFVDVQATPEEEGGANRIASGLSSFSQSDKDDDHSTVALSYYLLENYWGESPIFGNNLSQKGDLAYGNFGSCTLSNFQADARLAYVMVENGFVGFCLYFFFFLTFFFMPLPQVKKANHVKLYVSFAYFVLLTITEPGLFDRNILPLFFIYVYTFLMKRNNRLDLLVKLLRIRNAKKIIDNRSRI